MHQHRCAYNANPLTYLPNTRSTAACHETVCTKVYLPERYRYGVAYLPA